MDLLPAVLHELDVAGYELIGEGCRSRRRIPLNRVLETILLDHGDEARIINGVPLILAKAERERLRTLIKIKDNLVNPAGYLVETTAKALRDIDRIAIAQQLEVYMPYLLRRVDCEHEYTIPHHHGPAILSYLSKRRTGIARKWHVIDYNRESELKELLQKYL